MKLLLLCTYPYREGRHGGQIRVANLVECYQRAGFSVEVAGVLGSASYPKSAGFAAYPGLQALSTVIDNPFLMEDVALAQLFAEDDSYYRQLAAKIQSQPDVIHAEQPWLFGFAQRLVADKGWHKTRILYGSQNIECQLKAKILAAHLPPEIAEQYAGRVKQIELDATLKADAVVCVSEHDLQWTRQKISTPSILAANGVKPWSVTGKGIDAANKISGCRKFALLCASAHPPNMEGFFELLSNGFGSLSRDQYLVIAGSAGPAIVTDARLAASARLADSVVSAGIVDNDCLGGLLETAHCIVLPVTQGGGTNLKTAEALWAGRYIVSTTTAMRGFEQFIGSPGVFVSDQPAEFKQNLRLAMAAPPLQLSVEARRKREVVLWSHTLQALPQFIMDELNC
ncbi:MAG: glycosyltransferase [Gammaproteobacteria bacterium]|nr:glycosyltransferase [Gammaproteobacteria bacterium]